MEAVPSEHSLELASLVVLNKEDILRQFFESTNTKPEDDFSTYDCYFKYFEDQCELARQNDDPEARMCTLHNICSVVQQIKAGKERDMIKSSLCKASLGEERSTNIFNSVIDLAVRLYLMVYTGQFLRGVTSQSPITWKDGSLKDTITLKFQPQLVLTDSVKLQRIFNAKNLERIADVTIQWTPNLVDHLRFSEDGRKPILSIFHHATFLELQRESTLFPPGFIDETIRTLSLLLPTHDSSTRKWFGEQSRLHSLDPAAIACGQLKLEERQIEHFKYWHDRIVILKQYFDDSEPRTIKQWWYDDRKRVQWFWVAIVLVSCTILFGIIQCIEGGWQVWKAYHPST